MLVQSKELCQLCFRHLDSNKCWSLGKVPNCEVPECGAAHHSLLHDAIAKPRAMIVKRMDNESPNVLLCRQEAGVKRGREVIDQGERALRLGSYSVHDYSSGGSQGQSGSYATQGTRSVRAQRHEVHIRVHL